MEEWATNDMPFASSISQANLRRIWSCSSDCFFCDLQGLIQLKGHRSVGGVRASIYNALPLAGIQKLVKLMKEFQAKH